MADEPETKPRPRAKSKATAAPKAGAKKATKKSTAKKAPAKKPAARTSAAAKPTAKKAAPSAKTKPQPQPSVESDAMNQEHTSSNTERETFTKDPHLEPTGSLADKIWRLIAMTAFAMIAYFAVLGVIILAAVQFVVVVLDDKPSPEVGGYMFRLNSYLQEIVAFLAFTSNDMPFPFKPFPGKDD